jgi:hypothetical protein
MNSTVYFLAVRLITNLLRPYVTLWILPSHFIALFITNSWANLFIISSYYLRWSLYKKLFRATLMFSGTNVRHVRSKALSQSVNHRHHLSRKYSSEENPLILLTMNSTSPCVTPLTFISFTYKALYPVIYLLCSGSLRLPSLLNCVK